MKGDKISFSVSTIECVACTPVFKRELQKLPGVREVKPLVMTNEIVVAIDTQATSTDEVKGEILRVAAKVGFGGKIVFHT